MCEKSVLNKYCTGYSTAFLLIEILRNAKVSMTPLYPKALSTDCMYYLPGTDVVILKIFSPKKLAKILALLKRLLIFAKKIIIPLVSEKEPIPSPRIGAKIAENCDHNIDPCLCFFHVGKHPATTTLPI
jgi:hypothetical protein